MASAMERRTSRSCGAPSEKLTLLPEATDRMAAMKPGRPVVHLATIVFLSGSPSTAAQPECVLPPLRFIQRVDYPTGAGPSGLDQGDLNGDQMPDLAVTNEAAGTVLALFNRGNATFFRAQSMNTGGSPSSVAVLDLIDGNQFQPRDLAVASMDFDAVLFFIGEAFQEVRFRPAGTHPAGDGPRSLLAADLNGDGG